MPTKKDYLHVAAILHDERKRIRDLAATKPPLTLVGAIDTLRSIEDALCAYFYNDNPRFDVKKFLLASGARTEEVPDARP